VALLLALLENRPRCVSLPSLTAIPEVFIAEDTIPGEVAPLAMKKITSGSKPGAVTAVVPS
jgi:hypothetical protein